MYSFNISFKGGNHYGIYDIEGNPPQSPDGFTFDLQRFDSAFSGGDGSADNPYQIATVTDLQQLANDVNSGKYFKLTADIDLSGHNFTPIGNSDYRFKGVFDGDGHKISNLTIKSGSDKVGLFGYVDTGGTVKNVTLTDVDVTGKDNIGGLVGYNYGTVSGNKSYSNARDVSYNGSGGTVENNTRYYKLTLPDDVSASGDSITDGTNTYYNGSAVTLSGELKNDYVFSTGDSFTISADTTVTRIPNPANHYVFKDGNTYTLATADNVATAGYPELEQVYALTLQGVTVVTVDGTTYAKDSVIVAAKTGYTISGSTTITVAEDMTISATLDEANHYVFKSGNTYALATADNVATAGYSELVQVYELTLPEGVSVNSGTFATDSNGKYYAAGNVILSATAANAVIQSTSYTNNNDGTVSLTVSADTSVSSNDLTFYYTVSVPNCVDTVSGTEIEVSGTKYYLNGSTLNLTAKTGYVVDNVTVTSDTSISATLAEGHYVFGTEGNYTLATTDNIAANDYPELTQVYELTLQGVTVTGKIVATDTDGNTYAAGSVTVAAKTGYTISTGTVDVTEATTISATLDTNGHYVLASDTSTLATTTNTTDYPELTQVYELTLPEGVSATADITVTDNGVTYYAGNVKLSATDTSKALQNVTVNGASDDDGVFTVTADTKVTAEFVSNGGKSVNVGGTDADFSENNAVYSISASQQNSTIIGNAKNNTVVLTGGGENILTGGVGNDTYKFTAGGGIVKDFGIGATKSGNGKALSAPGGVDVVKVMGKVTGVYFDRDTSNKKSATFTAVVTYDSNDVAGDDTQIIVLKDITKKPTKYGSNPVYRTNDVAAATLKIWDTSGSSGKQAVISASKLKKFFCDDSELSTDLLQQVADLGKLDGIGELNLPAVDPLIQSAQATFNGDDNG